MIKIIYTFILSITFSVLVASNAFAGPKGPATQYEITISKNGVRISKKHR